MTESTQSLVFILGDQASGPELAQLRHACDSSERVFVEVLTQLPSDWQTGLTALRELQRAELDFAIAALRS